MRDDLLDANACVDWAVAQVKVFQDKLMAWNINRAYEVMAETDPQTGDHLLVAYLMGPLDPIVNVEVGVIINSIRTSLDLLASSLACRNGKTPDRGTHFPIFNSEQCMIDPLHGIEGKKWLTPTERAAIKALKPYQGGDHTLWPLHQLDILRKHERLISAQPDVSSFRYQRGRPGSPQGYVFMAGQRGIERLENKIVLARTGGTSAVPFDVTEGNAHIAARVTFDEAGIGIMDEEVAATLLRFAARVAEIIKLFDA